MFKRSTLIFAFCAFIQTIVYAQISISGLADFELRQAGEDSSPYVNQTPGENLSIYTPNLRLFISGNISDQWFINSALQADYYDGKELSDPFFSLLNINWTPDLNSNLLVTAGRFITPYGSYSNKFISSENPFVHLPMSHSSGLPVSATFGHLGDGISNPEDISRLYGEDEKGTTMVYSRMYSQGIRFSYAFGESKWLEINAAATLAPVSTHLDYGQYSSPAKVARITLQPVIWAKLGLSVSNGTFLQENAANDSLLIYDITSYKQKSKGADLTLNYRYYTLMLEWNNSFWKAPFYDPQTSDSDSPQTGLAETDHYSAEFVYDLPFLVGAYIATRYEHISNGEIEIYEKDNSDNRINQIFRDWTYSRTRIEFVTGYKLQRNITLKGSYLISDDDGPKLDDNVISIQLSVLF
jgi:hypothetical protein